MLDLIRYLLERNAKEVTSRVACSACVSHRTATLRGIVDAAPEVTENPTSGETDGRPQAVAQSRDNESLTRITHAQQAARDRDRDRDR